MEKRQAFELQTEITKHEKRLENDWSKIVVWKYFPWQVILKGWNNAGGKMLPLDFTLYFSPFLLICFYYSYKL